MKPVLVMTVVQRVYLIPLVYLKMVKVVSFLLHFTKIKTKNERGKKMIIDNPTTRGKRNPIEIRLKNSKPNNLQIFNK